MPHLVLELGSAATQLELACIGLGVAVVPGYAAQSLERVYRAQRTRNRALQAYGHVIPSPDKISRRYMS
jgi:DNA-binding transcriptional LysR family regulator